MSAIGGLRTMRLLLTRPEPDAERSAAALRQRGHAVVVAPLMRMEPLAADLAGSFAAVLITSANAARAIAAHARAGELRALPLFAVGARSATPRVKPVFANVTSADGALADTWCGSSPRQRAAGRGSSISRARIAPAISRAISAGTASRSRPR